MEKTTTVRVTYRVVDCYGFTVFESEMFTDTLMKAEEYLGCKMQQITIKNIPPR